MRLLHAGICSALAMLEEVKAGAPSFATRNLARAGAIKLSDHESRERHERQHLPMRGVSEHRGGDSRDRTREKGMRPFTYTSAHSIEDAIRAAGPDNCFIGGGTNLLDVMKLAWSGRRG
jgi:hypothetical protein